MINIDNININYKQIGKGKDVILLHGWGQNIEMMEPLAKIEGFKYTIIDFPGFGKSDDPTDDWNVKSYALMLKKLIDKLNLKKPIIIAHSFGGRVAVVYSSMFDVEKLVLLGTPVIRKEHVSFKQTLLKTFAKLPGLNNFKEFIKTKVGSTDYKNANPTMRRVLVNVINQDLSSEAKQIKAPTLLIWGTNDDAAPIEDAYLVEKLIPDCGLVALEGLTHYAYLENLNHVLKIIETFIGG